MRGWRAAAASLSFTTGARAAATGSRDRFAAWRPRSGCPAHLAEVTRVVLVEQDAVVVLTTCITAAAGVLAVLAHATVAGTDVPALLPVLTEPCSGEGPSQAREEGRQEAAAQHLCLHKRTRYKTVKTSIHMRLRSAAASPQGGPGMGGQARPRAPTEQGNARVVILTAAPTRARDAPERGRGDHAPWLSARRWPVCRAAPPAPMPLQLPACMPKSCSLSPGRPSCSLLPRV